MSPFVANSPTPFGSTLFVNNWWLMHALVAL
jgi:hypothetical protein